MTNKVQLLALMNNGATVITPNNRLSHELLNDFFKTNSKAVQDKPHCLPYSAFLQARFKTLRHQISEVAHPLVLTTQQLRYLWRKILTQSWSDFINDGLLQTIIEAWTRCHLWRINFNHASFSTTPQTRQFQQWCYDMQQALNTMDALTEAQLPNYLLHHEKSRSNETMIWACFDDYTPEQQALQEHYHANDCQLLHYDLAKQTSILYSYAAEDEQEEYQQLCLWLNECLSNNDKRVGVVVPNLQTIAPKLKRYLKEQLPEDKFNISLGKALTEYPLVAHALCWLQLDSEKITLQQATLLLHSPYLIHSQREMLGRAQLMEESQVLQEHTFALATFLKELAPFSPQLADALQNFASYPQQGSPEDWIHAFKTRLIHFGFPGEYPLNSATYQCYQRFLSLFDEFKQFTLITQVMTESEAISTLIDLAKTAIFQAQKSAATIQILGLLEASGATFDKLWVTGLTDQCLPQNAKPSAFIPLSLQRDLLMPHASPVREWELAHKAIIRFSHSSPTVIYSYPQLSDDKPNLPSPLIAGFAPFPLLQTDKPLTSSPLEKVVEHYQIAFTADEKAAGGTALLANQAKCPFRAFAFYRMNAQSTLETSEGPDARERGQVVHRILELLWQSLGDQKTLLTLDKNQLENYILAAIHEALEPLIHKRAQSFSSLIQEVELARLKRLVEACLDWERQRPHFTVIGLEQSFTINLAGIDFKVRVDRLDRVADGKTWVIDYKSKFPTTLPWNEERPKEPQLLLYALLDETINGLLFAQLRAGQMTCKGLSEESSEIDGLSKLKKEETWVDYRQHWQTQLQELAAEFSLGHCPPKPASASICQECELQSLCRFTLKS